jgi:hypothetical protein
VPAASPAGGQVDARPVSANEQRPHHTLLQSADQERLAVEEQGAGEGAGRQRSRKLSAVEFRHDNGSAGERLINARCDAAFVVQCQAPRILACGQSLEG